jgi:chemotaxis protein MotB
MNPKRRYHNRVSHERWLVSYADFITLMFAFFVVMFASARIDKERTAQLTEAIQAAFQDLSVNSPAKARPSSVRDSRQQNLHLDALARVSLPSSGLREANHKAEDFAAIQKELEKLLSPEIKRREVALRVDADGIIISLREIGFFDSGSAQIKPQAAGTVHRVATFLQGRNCSLRIEAIPITFRYTPLPLPRTGSSRQRAPPRLSSC